MKIRAQYLESKWSTNSIMTTIDLENVLDNPIEGVQKQDLPMWNFWQNDTTERNSKNCQYLTGLLLDFDGSMTIKEFEMRYYSYQYYLYTTMSHTENKHKFRVIIPFSDCLSVEQYTPEMRKALEVKFPFCDPTAFYKDHYFFLPAKPENGLYQYKINYAKLFNPKILTMTALVIASEKPVTKQYYTNDSEKVAKMEATIDRKLSEIINRQDDTGRYNDLLRQCYYFYKNGANPRLIESALSGYKNKNQIMKSLK